MMGEHNYHCIVVGGSFVGMSLAIGLAQLGLRVAVVDKQAFDPTVLKQDQHDQRGLALSQTSVNIFKSLHLWDKLALQACAINTVHVSQAGHLGRCCLRAHECGFDALGYVVPAYQLLADLADAMATYSTVSYFAPVTIESMTRDADIATLRLCDGRVLQAQLMIAADGAQSALRQQAGITVQQHDYGQTAIVANVAVQLDHQGQAFERFSKSGIVAMLPITGQRCVSVFTCHSDQAKRLLALSTMDYTQYLQAQFGFRLGQLSDMGQRVHYPLLRLVADAVTSRRLVIVGNAAHVLNPVAAQGFNLGLRDVAGLLQAVAKAPPDALADEQVLANYAAMRHQDVQQTQAFTDGLLQVFGLELPGLASIRAKGLLALDVLPPLKRHLCRRVMATRINPNPLCAGLPIEVLKQREYVG